MEADVCRCSKVLFVEDDDYVRDSMSTYLEECGFDLIVAPGVEAAFAVLDSAADQITAILTDVKMPDGSGVDILDRVQTFELPIPVIFLTAYASLDLAVAGIRKRAFDLVEKPADFDLLRELILKACRHFELLRLEKRYALELEQEIDRKTSEIKAQQIRLAELASELSRAEERERRRIASQLHDNIGQTLIFTKMKLEDMDDFPLPHHFRQVLEDAVTSLKSAILGIRALTTQISPPLLYEVGLVPAIESLADSFSAQYGLKVVVPPSNAIFELDQDTGIMVYQAIRELLVNVVKHAVATVAEVSIRCRGDRLLLDVTDNGRGFNVNDQRTDGFGLFSIRERLRRLGGDILITSNIGEGTVVSLSIPYTHLTT